MFIRAWTFIRDSTVSIFLEIHVHEPRHEKTCFLHIYAKTKVQISCAATVQMISAALIVKSLYFLNPKFQASDHHLWLYSPVVLKKGRKPQRQIFS